MLRHNPAAIIAYQVLPVNVTLYFFPEKTTLRRLDNPHRPGTIIVVSMISSDDSIYLSKPAGLSPERVRKEEMV
jgi:hypothetical protein